MVIKILLLAIIGGLIGWLTNIIAIKLIFRPLNPVVVPIINLEIQGLIPKRKSEIAKSIGVVVEEELLSIHEIIERVVSEDDIRSIKEVIKLKVSVIVEEKLPALIPTAFRKMIGNYIEELVDTEGEAVLKQLVEDMIDKATAKVSISEMVEEKINSYELDKIERIIISIAQTELKHIEILGGVLGVVIGLVQGFLVTLF